MQPIEKSSVPAGSRRSLHVAVFMRLDYPPVIIVLTGSDYPSMEPLEVYTNTKGGNFQKLGSLEYIKCLDTAIIELTKRGELEDIVLLQDKATPHTAKATKQWAETRKPEKLRLMLMPTDSPDISPLDSNYWGVVKQQLDTARARGSLDWDDTCQAALKIMAATPVGPHIRDVPLRLKACINSNGRCIESELKSLKKKRKAAQASASEEQIDQQHKGKRAAKKARRQ
jgi:hypothetical protein